MRTIPSSALLEELITIVQPGGKEEVASLLTYVRNLQSVSGIGEFRTVKMARTRAAALGLPATAPSEALELVASLTRVLEREQDAFLRTRLGLLRLVPEIQFPTETGVRMIVDTFEHELRQTAADEHTKQTKQDGGQGESCANKGKGKEKGKDKGKGKGKDTKGKQGKANVPPGSNSNAQDRQTGNPNPADANATRSKSLPPK